MNSFFYCIKLRNYQVYQIITKIKYYFFSEINLNFIISIIFWNQSTVNVIGTMNVIQFACQMMAENEKDKDGQRGVIINVSSICAYDNNSLHAYSASKGAISSMTSPLAFEFAKHGIRFMAIAPGLFSTPMINNLMNSGLEERLKYLESIVLSPKRFGNPLEFAALVHHIIENRYLNGEVIRLDGGLRLQQ
ncbi:unnamed protein product [Dracunculus medinensis]|uniref:Uncharacterized protein n=1 Tax=Dracunculus medinensis TaxID=318479 RepID=A0A0N4URM6_DRAME|nr:unnamed protein product [Dracunculus medinensis]